MSHATPEGLTTPTPAETAAVRLLLDREGLARTQELLGIGRHTVDRLRGCLPVHRSTIIAVRAALMAIGQSESRP